jgi:hypothetical protein
VLAGPAVGGREPVDVVITPRLHHRVAGATCPGRTGLALVSPEPVPRRTDGHQVRVRRSTVGRGRQRRGPPAGRPSVVGASRTSALVSTCPHIGYESRVRTRRQPARRAVSAVSHTSGRHEQPISTPQPVFSDE